MNNFNHTIQWTTHILSDFYEYLSKERDFSFHTTNAYEYDLTNQLYRILDESTLELKPINKDWL